VSVRTFLLANLPANLIGRYMVVAHVLCRCTALPLGFLLPPARNNDGQGARIARQISAFSLSVGTFLAFGLAVYLLRAAAWAPLLATSIVTALSGWYYQRRIRGVTGDCFGATIQLAEIVVYLCWSVAPMKVIILIRHPETAMAGRFCGHSDPDLNAAGERQMESIAQRVQRLHIGRVLSSDLRRAACTAQAISRRTGTAVELRPGLREIHFGKWENLSWAEIEESFPHDAALWLREFPRRAAPGGEPYAEFAARVRVEFAALQETNDDRVAAIVTHRGVLHFALTQLFALADTAAWEKTAGYGAIMIATRAKNPAISYQASGALNKSQYKLEEL
jgi:alpha-ribazole phosphatase